MDFAGRGNLLEADAIAARIHSGDPRKAAIAAGREVLLRTRGYLNSRQDFAVETTLSGAWTIKAIRQATAQGFFVRLVYICLDNPEQAFNESMSALSKAATMSPTKMFAAAMREVSPILSTL